MLGGPPWEVGPVFMDTWTQWPVCPWVLYKYSMRNFLFAHFMSLMRLFERRSISIFQQDSNFLKHLFKVVQGSYGEGLFQELRHLPIKKKNMAKTS